MDINERFLKDGFETLTITVTQSPSRFEGMISRGHQTMLLRESHVRMSALPRVWSRARRRWSFFLNE